jgi:type IV pilus assembly protein PilE
MTLANLSVPRTAARGFTLIELMVTVAIVGILAAVAYPMYTQSVLKSRRADAKTALLDLAQREERYMSTANQYSMTATPDLGYNTGTTVTGAAPLPVLSGSTAYYNLSVVVPAPGAPAGSTNSFLATAAPVGNQVKDTKCGSFTLSSAGVQAVLGTSSATPGDCW